MLLNYLFILFNMYGTIQFLFHIGYVFIVYLFLEIVPFHLNVLLFKVFLYYHSDGSRICIYNPYFIPDVGNVFSFIFVFSDIYQFLKSFTKKQHFISCFPLSFPDFTDFFSLILITSFLLFALVLFPSAVS